MTSSHSDPPLIAIPCDLKEVDGYRWHAVAQQYVNAVLHVSKCLPMLVPALGDDLDVDGLLDRVDGVLLSGSRSNVHPGRYGVPASEKHAPFDEARDSTTLPLIHAAVDRGVPLFAICRGFQELNVALAGSLITEVQEHEGRRDHRAPEHDDHDVRFGLRHHVDVTGSRLAAILGVDTIDVNSLHRQAVGSLSDRLHVEARADDGTIEAVTVKDAKGFALGVQWHPEYWARTDAPSHRLFEAFGEAARAARDGKLGHPQAAE